MKRSTALSAAAALTLTVAGGVSALALTMQPGATEPASTPTIVTEYVDQFGNPVAAPAALVSPTELAPPTVMVVDENGTPLSTIMPSQQAAVAPTPAPTAGAAQAPPAEYAAGGEIDQEHEEHDEHEAGEVDD